MQSWIWFVLIAQGIWAFCTVLDKIVIAKGHIRNPFVYITLNGFMNVFALLMLPFFGVELLPMNQMLVVLSWGVCNSAAVIAYYKAVSLDEISKIKIFDGMGPILTYLLAFILIGEFLTRNMLIAFFLFIIAGFIVSFNMKTKKIAMSKAVPYLLLSMVLGSFGAVAGKYVYTVTDFWNAFLLLRISGFAALLVLFVPRIREDFVKIFRAMPSKYRKIMCSKMVVDFSAYIFGGYAITMGPISIIAALSSAVMPIMVFLIALFLTIFHSHLIKEDISREAIAMKIISIVIVVFGVI